MTGSPLQQSIREVFAFGTKAQTLERLSGRLGLAQLCRQCVFDTNAWRADRNSVIDRISGMFPERNDRGPVQRGRRRQRSELNGGGLRKRR